MWLSKVLKEESVCIPALCKCPWSWSLVLSRVLKDGIVCGSDGLNCPLCPKYVTVHFFLKDCNCPWCWKREVLYDWIMGPVCWSKDGTVPGSELWNWPWFQKMEFAIVLKDWSVRSSDRRNRPLFPKYVIVKFPWRIVTAHGSERERRPPSWIMLVPLGSKNGIVHGAERWSWPWSWKPELSMVPNYVTVNFPADCKLSWFWKMELSEF